MRIDVTRTTRARVRTRVRLLPVCIAPVCLALASLLAPACTQLSHGGDNDDGADAARPDGGTGDGSDRGSGRKDGAAGGSSGHAGSDAAGSGGAGGAAPSMDGGDASSAGADAASDGGASDAGADGEVDARTGNVAPVVTIEFPLSGRTDAESITVRGVVHDGDGDAITSLTVNGTEVTADADGAFSTVVSLALGDNAMEVIAEDALGASSATAKVSVQRGPIRLWGHPSDVAIDYRNGRALFVDQSYDAVFALDLASGVATPIADASADLGPEVTTPSSIEIDYDTDQYAYVLTSNPSSQLQRIDLSTLDRTTIPLSLGSLYITAIAMDHGKLYAAGGSTFFEIQLPAGTPRMISDDADTMLGPALQAATALAIDGNQQVAYLIHQSDGTIKRVSLPSGTRTLFSGGGQGSGPNLSKPMAAVYDYGGQRVLISDDGQHGLFAVSTATATAGARSILADATTGTGVPLHTPTGFAFDAVTQRALIADWKRPQFIIGQRGALVWVDLASGQRTYVSNGVGSGQGLALPAGLIADPDNDRVLLLDYDAGALIALHLGTGNRLVLSDAIAGQGPPMIGPNGMVADTANDRVFVADTARKAIFSIDLGTGDRTLLSDNDGQGSGTMFEGPVSLLYDAPNDRLLVADNGTNSKIVSVNLVGGNRLVLSDNTRTGPSLDQVQEIAFAPGDANTLLAAVGADVLSVDLISGNRVYERQHDANQETGEFGFVFEQDHWYALSLDANTGALDLIRVELADGTRTLVSGATRGSGPLALRLPLGWHSTLFGRVLLVSEGDAGMVLAVDTVSGDRLVFSR